MTELLEVRLIDNGINTTPEALEIASNLHTELTAIVVVNSPATQAAAVAVAVQAQRFWKDVEASRKAVKEPVLEVGRKIDALAKELSEPVTAEMKRVGLMVARFQMMENARVAEEKRKREEAEQAAIRAKFEADEAARKAASQMTTDADLTKAIEAEDAAKVATDRMYDTLQAEAPAPIKAAGSATRASLDFEVTDIHQLYKSNPMLVKLEANRAAIKAMLTPGLAIPGIRIFETVKTSFRS